MGEYELVKAQVIRIVDEFTKRDLVGGYNSVFNAKTKLSSLGISRPMRGWMSRPLNKALTKALGKTIRQIGMIDLQETESMGDVILLACRRTSTVVLNGEPT